MAKASSQQSESKEKTTKSTAKKAPAKKAAPKKETAKAKSAAASKKKAVEAEAAEAHDLEEDDTENILESDVEPTDLHDDHHDVKASDLTDESLLEGVPEEELRTETAKGRGVAWMPASRPFRSTQIRCCNAIACLGCRSLSGCPSLLFAHASSIV